MAKTTIPVELSSTPGITDNSNATAITIDSSELVSIGNTSAGSMHSNANKLVVGTGSGDQGMSIYAGTSTGRYAFARAVGNNTDAYDGGMTYDGSRNLTFHTNAGSERMRIDGSGRVAIGVNNPADYYATNLVVQGASEGGITLASTSTSVWNYIMFADGTSGDERYRGYFGYHHGTDQLTMATAGTQKLAITSTGQLQSKSLGVSTPTFSFDNDTNTGMTRPTGDTLQLVCGGSAIVRIDTTDTMFGKASNDINTAGFHIISAGTYAGSCYSGITSAVASSTYHVRDTTNNTWEFYVSNAGVISATSTSITSLSDERLKENIKDLETGLDEVMALKPRRFDWKDRKEKNVAGFIAQEVEPVLPDLIGDYMHDDLDDAKSVKMGDMIPTLVKAIQELKAEIEELKK